ncbi:hypothetical protein AB1Y20_008908 [Prymnesium parvum]|uniref:Aminopeptidase N n=1 Tax=Prymnesium parvum TaxID=97485 RepID=A0AB34K2L6_PRYPA
MLALSLLSSALRLAPHARSLASLRGGSVGMASSAVVDAPVERFRKDYALPAQLVGAVELKFEIFETETLVHAALHVEPASPPRREPMVLDGEELALRSIEMDGAPLVEGSDFTLSAAGLTLLSPPLTPFTLRTVVAIKPQENTQLSGLYKSSGNFVTQCEAEGFRRITYFQDRPDIMATYKVRIEADKQAYPLLLSNGNEVGKGDLPSGRHFAEFVDPFRKPSYLFACVAGKLDGIEDKYTTASGRDVRLAIWSEPENIDQLGWAMQSLKDAMRWDEQTYGLEYDLDVYHIVAVNDFNMGAMENKGLNVFNTACVLAKPSTATDDDYERVQGVVAHEYFHNWSGNRVTCRDWFQLTLKEGLTVFRDQHFSSDMTSEAVKRIEDARIMRSAQFAQDAGPMAHPIRPESYIAMDNFYTVTVYNKGAEVIRMYRTLLGAQGFRKGMDLYFARHDGQAVTCDDFRAAMADANGRDLTQFERWYLQAGTPTVKARGEYDAEGGVYSLTLSQTTPPTPGQPHKLPFHIPVVTGLLARDGTTLVDSTVLELTEEEQTFKFEGITSPPVVSLLRGFSAPVKVDLPRSDEELAFLAANDADPFNRWDASQRLATRVLLEMAAGCDATQTDALEKEVPSSLIDAFRATLCAPGLDNSLKAYSLSLPDFGTLSQEMDPIEPDSLLAALKATRKAIARQLHSELAAAYDALAPPAGAAFTLEPEAVGRRRLRNVCLSYLAKLGDEDRALAQFRSATCMTESIAAVRALVESPGAARDEVLSTFYERAKANKEALVINKWLAVQAAADTPDALETVKSLMAHESFDANNPNTLRSVVNTFAGANPAGFHKADGSGYRFISEQVIDIDKRNPQVAARLCNAFNTWRRYSGARQDMMKGELMRIKESPGLSKDTFEIASRSLA